MFESLAKLEKFVWNGNNLFALKSLVSLIGKNHPLKILILSSHKNKEYKGKLEAPLQKIFPCIQKIVY